MLPDCQAVRTEHICGPKWTTAPARHYTRIWATIYAAGDDGESAALVGWMSVHTSIDDVGVTPKSDGVAVGCVDRSS